MTATDELRRLLDERRVEWGNVRNDGSESEYLTEWQFDDYESRAIAVEWAVGSGLSVEIRRYRLTPEQAIAATLGAGTCRYELKDGRFVCSNCGRSTWAYEGKGDPLSPPNFCPNCGKRIV